MELLCFYALGGAEYGWWAFKAPIYTRYTCFKAFWSAVNFCFFFVLYRWEGHAPFLSLFFLPPACFSVWVSLSEIEATESYSSLKKWPPDMSNRASFGCNCLTNVREFQRKQKERKEKANQPSKNRGRGKNWFGGEIAQGKWNHILWHAMFRQAENRGWPLPSICKDVEENPYIWGSNTKRGLQETQAALRHLPSPIEGLSSSWDFVCGEFLWPVHMET